MPQTTANAEPSTGSGELPKTYRPEEAEAAVSRRWDETGAFDADPQRVLSDGAAPYSILIPPPNVTAALHLGHALNNTLQDILVRAHRMMGDETMWMPGTDHAGIATQTVVEKRLLAEEGKRRTDYQRDEFIAKVQSWKDEYESTITEQLKGMGCSCDWRRQRFTMDDQCASAVRACFFRLFNDGLIYRGKRLVNWDPVTQTALADDEVENKELNGKFTYLRYPLVHTPRNPDDPMDTEPVTWGELAARGYPDSRQHGVDDPAWVTVATTRPETYLGDTAVAVNPGDPRTNSLRGLMVQLPLVGRVIPIIEDDYVVLPDPSSDDVKARYATGFLKVTPAHDPNDYDLGMRHKLPMINVMAPDASISDRHGWEDVGDAHLFVGMSREDARKKVLKEFDARGLLEEIRDYTHSVGHSYRSHAAIEPYLSDQWYVRVTDDRLRGAALAAMCPTQRSGSTHAPRNGVPTDGGLKFHPERYAKTFETWHENLRDWCISRQLWWGHRIPVWGLPSSALAKLGVTLEAHLESLAPWIRDGRISATVDGEPLTVVDGRIISIAAPCDDDEREVFVCVARADDDEVVGRLEADGFVQDPDVLDTWFSSALWPMSTMGWPDPTAFPETSDLLDAFNPTNVLCTAREIITLWVSRMVMFNRYLLTEEGAEPGTGRLPFTDVFIHAMIQDGDGRKMSKSLGNGVDPRDIIASHGADALRFTLCKMTTHTQDVRMPVVFDESIGKNSSPKFDEGRNFCNKVWNSVRFAIGILGSGTASDEIIDPCDLSLADRWMLSRLWSGVRAAEQALATYEYSSYANTLYDLHWRQLCDWYLEAIKPTVQSDAGQQAVLRCSLEVILRLMHPVMPFITEALHEHLSQIRTPRIRGIELCTGDMLCTSSWPVVDESLHDPGAILEGDEIRLVVESVRQIRAQHSVPPKRRVVLHVPQTLKDAINKHGSLVMALAGLEAVTTDEPGGASVSFLAGTANLRVSKLADELDTGAERQRLLSQIEDLDKSIGALDKRLSNPGYTDKAPAHLVDQTREQHAMAVAERNAAMHELEQLGNGS